MDRQLLARATESTDAPTPGYMYMDIAKNAASNPATCQEIAQYLTRRLASKNNCNIKYKCLKVISKTAASPYLRGQFKRYVAQDTTAVAAIKDALNFRGPTDPVRGDEPNARVREAAKEALEAIYSDTQAEQTSAPFATNVSSSYGGPPSQQYGGQSSYSSNGGTGRRMEGIGNPMFKDPRLEPQPQGIANMTVQDALREAKETVVGIIKDPLARNVEPHVNNRMGTVPRPGGMPGYGSGSYGHPPGRNELVHATNGQWTMKSNRGPDAIVPPPNYDRDAAYFKARDSGGNAYSWAQKEGGGASGGVGGSWASAPSVASQAREPAYGQQQTYQQTPSITVSGGSMGGNGQGGTALSDGSYEKQLIMELCPPGGMKAEPPPDKLAQFARSVSNLNPDLVCPALLDCLEDGQPWIIRAKALCVMETCIKSGKKVGSDTNAYADFFHACHGEIQPLATHARAAIRDPAKRVLRLLGFDPNSGAAHAAPVAAAAPPVSAPPPAAAPPAPVPNLLDFDDAGAAPAPPLQAPSAPSTDSGNSLFGGLKVQGNNAPAPAQATAPAPPPAPAPSDSADLLGDFASGGGGSGGSLFDGVAVKQTPAPTEQTSTVTSMFDNMSMKAQPKASAEEGVTSVAAGGGSAFGFINQNTPADAGDKQEGAPAQQPAAAAAAAAPVTAMHTKDSFDPLKNVTPNTAKQMMQLSPEQMQAMAYQQLMMQQQMQMQMQMAMAMQQQRGGVQGFRPMNSAVMQNPAAARTSLAFLGKPEKKEDKSFDFVRDAMTMEKKK